MTPNDGIVSSRPPNAAQVAKRRRLNLGLAFLGQNCALGLAYGAYGTLLHPLEIEFSVTRAVASAGMSALLLGLCLGSPVVGKVLQFISIRHAMIAGAAFSGLAYVSLAMAASITIVLISFAVLGLGCTLLGVIGPTTLVSRWYTASRGGALGIVNLPIFLLLTPLAVAALLPSVGLRGIYTVLAVIQFALVPALMLVTDRPASAETALPEAIATSNGAGLPLRPILIDPRFWLFVVGIGILTGAGTSFVVHFFSFATSRGLTTQQAAVILSGYGLCGVAGTYLFGRLTDRIAPHIILGVNALCCAALWTAILAFDAFVPLLLIGCLIGACATALVALQGAAISQMFGVPYVSNVMGITYLLKLPFIFGAAPMVGYLFDRSGSYVPGFGVHIISFLLAAGAFAAIGYLSRSTRPLTDAPKPGNRG